MATELTPGYKSLILTVDVPKEDDGITPRQDLVGVKVWCSSTNGFTPGPSNLVYDGVNTVIEIKNLVAGTTYYVKYAMVSDIDPSILDITPESTYLSASPSAIAVTGTLTNDSHVVITESDGTGGVYTDAGGIFSVHNGTEVVTSGVTYSVASATAGLSISVDSSGIYTISGLTVDSAVAVLRAVYIGVTIDKKYSIAKAKKGVDGTSGGRGSITVYDSTNTVPTTALATAAICNALGLVVSESNLVLGDIVIFSRASTANKYYSWDGSMWDVSSFYFDGNVLVDGSLTASKLAASLTVTNTLNITSGGKIYSGKTTPASTTAGFWLGDDSGTAKFAIGDASKSMTWNGSSLTVVGDIIATSNLSTSASNKLYYSSPMNGTFNAYDFYTGSQTEPSITNVNIPDSNIEGILFTFSCSHSNQNTTGRYILNIDLTFDGNKIDTTFSNSAASFSSIMASEMAIPVQRTIFLPKSNAAMTVGDHTLSFNVTASTTNNTLNKISDISLFAQVIKR